MGKFIFFQKRISTILTVLPTLKISFSRLELIGCVLDSCPTPMVYWPYIAQMLNMDYSKDSDIARHFPLMFLPFTFGYFEYTENKQNVLTSAKQALTIAPKSYKNYMKFGPNAWGGQYLKMVEDENWPLLFLYSKKDNLVPHTYVDKIIQGKRQQNPSRLISTRKFDKSGHVAHLRKYPEAYKEELQQFLIQCHTKSKL